MKGYKRERERHDADHLNRLLLVDPVSLQLNTVLVHPYIGDTIHNGQRVGIQPSSILTYCPEEIEEMGAQLDARVPFQQLEV
jgi:hypothetical protein